MRASKWNTFRASCVHFLTERMEGWRDTNASGVPTNAVQKHLLDNKLLVGFDAPDVFDVRRRFFMTYLGVPFWMERTVVIILHKELIVEIVKTVYLYNTNEGSCGAKPLDLTRGCFSLDDHKGRSHKIVNEWCHGWFPDIERFLNDPYDAAQHIAPWAKEFLLTKDKE